MIVAVIAVVAVVAVVLVTRGLADDPPTRPSSEGETSDGPPTAGSPTATGTPGSKPSSGPTGTPEPGSLEPVEVEEPETAPPVDLDETGDFGTGVTLLVDDIEAVDGVARGPGQVSGPALRLVMEARNASKGSVSLEGMVVALAYGADDTPAMRLSEPGERPFEGELPAKGETRAVYVFAIPEEARGQISVSASYTGSAPTVVFEGAANG